MKLLNLCFLYTPGTYMYHQQIKGKDNYDHRYGKKSFNGYGGCHEYGGSELLLAGERMRMEGHSNWMSKNRYWSYLEEKS